MSNADVKFDKLDEEYAPTGEEQRFWFKCPKYGHACGPLIISGRTNIKRDGQGLNGGRPQWDWDGNKEKPTFRPSINCNGCWHGYIRDGRCVNTSGQDEPEPPVRKD